MMQHEDPSARLDAQSAPSLPHSPEVLKGDAKVEEFLRELVTAALRDSDSTHQAPYKFTERFNELKKRDDSGLNLSFLRSLAEFSLKPEIRDLLMPIYQDRNFSEAGNAALYFVRDVSRTLQSHYAHHLVDTALSPLRMAVESGDLPKLYEAIGNAKKAGLELYEKVKFRDYDDKPISPTYDELLRNHFLISRGELTFRGGSASLDAEFYKALLQAIARGEVWSEYYREGTEFDHESHAALVKKYGAKGAGLVALKSATSALEKIFAVLGKQVKVPDFTLIPADVYQNYQEGEQVDAQLRSAFEWVQGRSVMVRSSAVHSEDGEHLGAGVYESLLLPANASFDLFKKAVEAVYASVNSQKALKYRERIGCPEREQMGVIIQEYVESEGDEELGYVNTVRAKIPEALQVTFQSRYFPPFTGEDVLPIEDGFASTFVLSRPVLKDHLYSNREDYSQGFIITPDAKRMNSEHLFAPEISLIALAIEKYLGRPQQIEFLYGNSICNLFQARPLPAQWITASKVSFPSGLEELWRARSLGVIDQVLDVLPGYEDNREKSGIVIFGSSHMGSCKMGEIERALPRDGVVMLLYVSKNMHGHIESSCLERGLTIITGETIGEGEDGGREMYLERLDRAYGSEVVPMVSTGSFDNGPRALSPTGRFNKLRVVSDGLEARVYLAENE